MDSIESLRKMDDDELIALGNGQYGRDYRHGRIADEIEAEIAKKYMLLPVDADGVPIHVGDMVYSASTPDGVKVGWVDSLSFCDTSASYRNADAFRHKRRTIEDVLEDFLIAFDDWDWNNDGDDRDEMRKELFAKYADELRSMGVSE